MNIDEYLDLQDQTETNLLSTEDATSVPLGEQEIEWHSATPTTLPTNNNDSYDNWGSLLQQTGFETLDGINLTDLIAAGSTGIDTTATVALVDHNFITPDSLMKQPPPAPLVIPDVETQVEQPEPKRVTRSRMKPTPAAPKKKKTTRAKKLYCLCQQPYNGEPMVQCDICEEWYHCTCVDFNPDDEEQEQENIDWVCSSCKQVANEPKIKILVKEEKTNNNNGRQTRTRTHSKCLYSGCNNRTQKDSFCSDVCARKQNELEAPPARASRKTASMRTSAQSMTPKIDHDREDQISDAHEDEEEDGDDSQEEFQQDEQEEQDEQEAVEPATPDTPRSPSQMTEQENPVRRNVIKNLKTVLTGISDVVLAENGGMMNESTLTSEERAEALAKSIENTMLEQLGDSGVGRKQRTCGEPYKSKFRSLLYNLKDKANKVFQIRVVTGDLTPDELVKMSSEDMANPELKSMSEVFRKTGLKNSVMKIDNTPIIKKTHKGDIIMVPDKDNDNMYSEQVQQQLDKIDKPHSPAIITDNKQPPTSSLAISPTTSSTHPLDPLDDILARIGIPAQDDNSHVSNKRTGSMSDAALAEDTDPEVKKRRVTLDVEELLGDEDETLQVDEVDTTEEEHDKAAQQNEEMDTVQQQDAETLPTIWQGRVSMPQVAEFEASARQIGGRLLTDAEWDQVLSPTMWIEGRIPSERVTNYVTQTQYSTSREIVLLEVEAKGGDDNKQGQILLNYLDSRQRYAVVGHNKTRIKDFYLVPLYKVQHIPDCLYVVRVEETQRQCDLFLGVLVLTKQTQMPAIEQPRQTPAISTETLHQQQGASPYQPSYGNDNNNNQRYDHYSSSYYKPY